MRSVLEETLNNVITAEDVMSGNDFGLRIVKCQRGTVLIEKEPRPAGMDNSQVNNRLTHLVISKSVMSQMLVCWQQMTLAMIIERAWLVHCETGVLAELASGFVGVAPVTAHSGRCRAGCILPTNDCDFACMEL